MSPILRAFVCSAAISFGLSGSPLMADGGDGEYPSGFKAFKMRGAPDCSRPNEQTLTEYEEYGAVGICYSYSMRRDADIFSNITNAVFDIMTLGGFFEQTPLGGAVLWVPQQGTVRFEVKRNDERYRLCKYWRTDISNIPPPGRYTDHKFVNVTDYSIDYYTKIRQRGFGRNSRIAGKAYALFVPESSYHQAISDEFCEDR